MNIEKKENLTNAILWLEYLLHKKVLKESSYQLFFESNSIVFEVLGYTKAIPLTKASGKSLPRDEFSGLKPEPDFIVENENGIYEIFEIKTPIEQKIIRDSNAYRTHFTSSIVSYISQTTTYDEYFDNPANRVLVNELFETNIQKKLPIKIIIGLDEYIDKDVVYAQTTQYHRRIDFITYNDILNKLKSIYQKEFGQYENIPGFSYHVAFEVNPNSGKQRRYLVDVGDVNTLTKNRLSFYIDENDNLCYEVISDNGVSHKMVVEKEHVDFFNNMTYIACEYASKENSFYMSIAVNGKEYETSIKHAYINIKNIQGNMILGSDLTHRFGFHGAIGMYSVYLQTIDYFTRQTLFEQFNQKYNVVTLQEIPL